jgi:predicted permease
MRSLRRFLRRLWSFATGRRDEERLKEEIQEHLALQTAENLRAGLAPAEAHRQAMMKFGPVEAIKEDYRAERGLPFFDTLLRDIHFALRMLRKSPGFTVVAVVTLALGIGANTAIFSLVDWLILRPLPIDRPIEVVFLETSYNNGDTGTQFSYPNFQRIQQQTSGIFADISALQMFQMDGLSVDGKSQPMWSNYVDGGFFSLLGIKPALGRFILPTEGNVAGADPVLVLGYSYWKSRFSSDPNIIGKKVSVNGHPMTIVGVAPHYFQGLAAMLDIQGYMPLAMAGVLQDAPKDFLTDSKNTNLELIARLKTGVSLQQTQPALQVAAQRLSEQYRRDMTVRALPLGPASLVTGPGVRPALGLVSSLFLVLAGAVLILACMNIANICLVRAAARHREVALRAALGATRGRLIRQLLTESLLLATLGAAGGILLGIAASRSFGSISLHTALPTVLDFHFDWRVFAYALAAAALTGLLVGITPALRVSRFDLSEILHEGGRTSTAGRQRLRSALVTAQVAGSLMLLIVAGLFVRSLEKVRHSDLGFDPSHVLNVSIDPHEAGYDENVARQFQETLLERARALPGVESASLAISVPMGYSSYGSQLKVEGYQARPGEKAPAAGFNAVSPQYFRTMRIPLIQGRCFQDSDGQNSQPVAIVNQNFADLYWHGQNPIGRQFSTLGDPSNVMNVIGVTRSSNDSDIFTSNYIFYYVPLTQYYKSVATLQLRSASAPEALATEVTGLVHSLEPAMPVFDVQPMTTTIEGLNGFLAFRFAAALAGSLGILGLILAVVGVYGVISYAASQRTHEIGIRLALGAQPAQILKMVLNQGSLIVGIGVLAGILAAGALARLVGNFLFGVAALDPLTYISASLLLAAIALLACYLPARRAMRVDPILALRCE